MKQVQQLHFQQELQGLPDKNKNARAKQLGLYQDKDGILRCEGRLHHSSLPHDAKFPILLPNKSHFTSLVIQHHHKKMHHCGTQQTLASVRQRFWIIKGGQAVRSVLTKCLPCKRIAGGPFKLPAIPPLPVDRVTRAKPFEFTGLDYFGPIWVKSEDEKKKNWVCLFTCLVTRAVHLEPVSDMTAQEFLSSLRRFIARRGQPVKVLSDNAPHFKLTNDTLHYVWSSISQDATVLNYCSQEGIDWQFITQYAPWKGGVYERLVGTVKSTLKRAIGRKLLTKSEFHTLLCEAEA
ncbi:MAG: transposase family protein, partial [Gammaproteobacteria bacterium]|nr:transposase family protein [Gammaproteobacteria bacterium]